jgi:hypothetical protein
LTVFTEQPAKSAARLFATPSAAISTIRALLAAPARRLAERAVSSKTSRSPSRNASAGAGLLATPHYRKNTQPVNYLPNATLSRLAWQGQAFGPRRLGEGLVQSGEFPAQGQSQAQVGRVIAALAVPDLFKQLGELCAGFVSASRWIDPPTLIGRLVDKQALGPKSRDRQGRNAVAQAEAARAGVENNSGGEQSAQGVPQPSEVPGVRERWRSRRLDLDSHN